MFGHEAAKIPRCVSGQGRFREMRVIGKEPIGFGFQIGEIAAAPARYPYFLGGLLGMIQDQHRSTALRDSRAAEQTSRACA